MNKKILNDFLYTKGYHMYASNIPILNLHIKENEIDNSINIIATLDNTEKLFINTEQLNNIQFQIERKYLLTQTKTVNILFCIYSNNIERDKTLTDTNAKIWFIDEKLGMLMVYENQPEDFCGLRKDLEKLIIDEYTSNSENSKKMYYDINRNINKNKVYIPIMTIILIAVNIIVFLIMEKNGSTENTAFMLKNGAAYWKYIFVNNEYYRLITCMFMHFGLAHLLTNMVGLWILGMESEKCYGRIRYIILYMISGIGGSFISSLYYMQTNQMVVSAGASGAIYGILGTILVKVIEERKKEGYSSITRIILVLVLLISSGQSGSGIDHLAHIGGFIVGLLFGIVFYKTRRKEY